jgi:hypothetical protein
MTFTKSLSRETETMTNQFENGDTVRLLDDAGHMTGGGLTYHVWTVREVLARALFSTRSPDGKTITTVSKPRRYIIEMGGEYGSGRFDTKTGNQLVAMADDDTCSWKF